MRYITILFSGYSTMPCAPAFFSRGMMSRTVDLVEDGVDRQPLLVAEVRDGRPLQGGQDGQHGREVAPCAHSASARLCPAR